jgi:hypothetical protein
MRSITRGGLALSLFAALVLIIAGCGGGGSNKQSEADSKKDKDSQAQADKDKGGDKSAHEGWWCDEHGITEAECIMCSPNLKQEAKANGDWCKHNRAKSQCFACNPKLKDMYAAKYRAKYPGKEPPPVTDND